MEGLGIVGIGALIGSLFGNVKLGALTGLAAYIGYRFLIPKKVETIAQEAAEGSKQLTELFRDLSARMCWNAVYHCGYLAGKQSCPKNTEISEQETGKDLISYAVNGKPANQNIPAGCIIGFFTLDKDDKDAKIIHMMISAGNGQAFGNKNACIGVGSPSGWEKIDLPVINDGQFTQTNETGNRTVMVRYREEW